MAKIYLASWSWSIHSPEYENRLFEENGLSDKHPLNFFISINEDNKPDLISTCVSNLLSPASFAPKLVQDTFLIIFRS